MLTSKELRENRKLFNGNDVQIVSMFKALNEINRYRILCILTKNPSLSVGDIAEILNISLPLASQHIKVLTQCHLLQKEREGKKVISKLKYDNPFVHAIVQVIQKAQTD
jgi:DNA-binding transcriptional ArsR family regulator